MALVVTGVALISRGSNGAPSTSAAAGESMHLGGPANPLSASPAEQRAAVDRIGAVGRPVLCGGGSKPLVALTFDDGPGPYSRYTLRVLREHHARATFFLVAKEVLGWPGLADIPHMEAVHDAVGNHTFDHSSLPGLTADELDHQLGDAQTVIEAAAKRDVRLFRPPYGAHDAAVDAEVGSLGMLQVLWSVDTMDSRGATAGDIVATIRSDVRPGSIVLLHENRGTTRNAMPRILDVLGQRHLRAVTVPELLAADPPSPAQLSSGSCD